MLYTHVCISIFAQQTNFRIHPLPSIYVHFYLYSVSKLQIYKRVGVVNRTRNEAKSPIS